MLIVFHTLPIGVGKSALCASVILVESSPVVLLYGMDAQRIRKVRKVYGGIWIETAEINLIACIEEGILKTLVRSEQAGSAPIGSNNWIIFCTVVWYSLRMEELFKLIFLSNLK